MVKSAENRGLSPVQVKPKTIKLVLAASPLRLEQQQIGSESGKCVRVEQHVHPRIVVSVG